MHSFFCGDMKAQRHNQDDRESGHQNEFWQTWDQDLQINLNNAYALPTMALIVQYMF